MRKIAIKWDDWATAGLAGGQDASAYFDTTTGAVVVFPEETIGRLDDLDEAGIEQLAEWEREELRLAASVRADTQGRWLEIPQDIFETAAHDFRDFIDTVTDASKREELDQALEGRGGFRRFRAAIQDCFRERKQWFAFEELRQRERATDWLASQGIEAEWQLPPPAPPEPDPRERLLALVLKFVRNASSLPGVKRIALMGSLTRDEPDPKDADLLVTVSDAMDLAPLAAAGRKIKGAAQGMGHGADIFLSDERGNYIGRTCSWKSCGGRPGCDAHNCGDREYLCDDFRRVRLKPDLVAAPPVELWPNIHARVAIPDDVDRLVVQPLKTG
jgi:hypothetical protein